MWRSTITSWALRVGNLSWLRREAERIVRLSESYRTYSDEGLLHQGHMLRWQAKSGVPLAQLMPTVYAVTMEASSRALGLRHYPVQVMGGIGLFWGRVIEMQTGEGKTLTAVLPTVLRALPGLGCHVVTSNDYLAQRDAETMGNVFSRLGLSVGCVHGALDTDGRRGEYARDITYTTGTELGFDFLRDRLRIGAAQDGPRRTIFQDQSGEAPVQRGHYYALIDEADGILVDSARTPLIIGAEFPDSSAQLKLYEWAIAICSQLTAQEDFVYEQEKRLAWLTERGCRKLTLLAKPTAIDSISTERVYEQVERSLTALLGFQRNRDYIVSGDEITLISVASGRRLDGQKWQEGLHQAMEAKEGLPITADSRVAARVTLQTFFSHYQHLAGMSGTATPAKAEFRKYYKMGVTRIPTHRPCRRHGWKTRIFVSRLAKNYALVREVQRMVQSQRSILVGTSSVLISEWLSEEFRKAEIEHVVLNALQDEQEAAIVAKAGQPGHVTIATNMAGRGTDILLHDLVRKNGGLHVIATEMHSTARVDRQLIGRAARQGDPGTFQFLLSLEDELLQGLGAAPLARLQQRARPDENGELNASWQRVFRRLQRRQERAQARERMSVFKQERQRLQGLMNAGLDPFLEAAG